jgi:steroid delta-isomerase-like uncharacterized protein
MSAIDTAKKAVEAVNRHDADGFVQLYSERAVAYDPQYPEPLQGREAIRQDIIGFLTAFPDVTATVSNVLANGDTVGFEVVITGTHLGPLAVPDGAIPPTGRTIELRGGRFVTVDGEGRITDCRRYYDMAGIMQQLGLM